MRPVTMKNVTKVSKLAIATFEGEGYVNLLLSQREIKMRLEADGFGWYEQDGILFTGEQFNDGQIHLPTTNWMLFDLLNFLDPIEDEPTEAKGYAQSLPFDTGDICPVTVKCKSNDGFEQELKVGQIYTVIGVSYNRLQDVWMVRLFDNDAEARDFSSLLFTPYEL